MNTTFKELSIMLKEITILFVEDNEEARVTTADILTHYSNNILIAKDGKEALELFRNNDIQLIISDIEMPIMNGINFITEVRKVDLTIPVVMITAYKSADYLLECANLNIQSYILKPINSTKLKDSLYKVVKYLNLTSNILIHITDELSYDKVNSTLIENNVHTTLNKKETLFMNILVESKNKLVHYTNIEHAVWTSQQEVMSESALRTLVKNLRKKSSVKFITNISGIGYKLQES